MESLALHILIGVVGFIIGIVWAYKDVRNLSNKKLEEHLEKV